MYIYIAIIYLHALSELFMRDVLNFNPSASCLVQAVNVPLTSEKENGPRRQRRWLPCGARRGFGRARVRGAHPNGVT